MNKQEKSLYFDEMIVILNKHGIGIANIEGWAWGILDTTYARKGQIIHRDDNDTVTFSQCFDEVISYLVAQMNKQRASERDTP